MLLWLPRTKENFSYVVRSLRNYLNRMDPDCFQAVLDLCRPMLDRLWADTKAESDLANNRPLWLEAEHARHQAYAETRVSFWDMRRHFPVAVRRYDQVVAVARPLLDVAQCVAHRVSLRGFLWTTGAIVSTGLMARSCHIWAPWMRQGYMVLFQGLLRVSHFVRSAMGPDFDPVRIWVERNGTMTMEAVAPFSDCSH